jgi:hypothetical protein
MEQYYGTNSSFTTKVLDLNSNDVCIMCLKVDKIEKPAIYEAYMTTGLGLQKSFLCQSCVNWTLNYHNLKNSKS